MSYRSGLREMVCVGLALLLAGVAGVRPVMGQGTGKKAVVQMDRQSLQDHLRAMGYKVRGHIGREKTDSGDARYESLPHFTGSFSVGGTTYPYTMLGNPPKSGKPATLRSVIIPLRMQFVGFGPNGDVSVTFDPTAAVTNIVHSPIYVDAQFPNGRGQFGDMMQRATFWNKMDEDREWHVRMADPIVAKTVDIEVTPETGTLSQVGPNTYFGDVLIDFIDSQALTIIQLAGLDADEVPIFVTDNVTAQALGYHSAFPVAKAGGKETLQTYIYTSWLDPALVDPLVADVSTFNHEEGEWLNDPFVNNVVPTWAFPPPNDSRTVCSGSNVLEVGDPQGNGPTYDDFPTVVVPIDGVNYHLQDLVMLPWFADEVPSSAQNGWYDFPATTDIHVPAVYCH